MLVPSCCERNPRIQNWSMLIAHARLIIKILSSNWTLVISAGYQMMVLRHRQCVCATISPYSLYLYRFYISLYAPNLLTIHRMPFLNANSIIQCLTSVGISLWPFDGCNKWPNGVLSSISITRHMVSTPTRL